MDRLGVQRDGDEEGVGWDSVMNSGLWAASRQLKTGPKGRFPPCTYGGWGPLLVDLSHLLLITASDPFLPVVSGGFGANRCVVSG
jgi:hypothetical protein